MAIEAAPEDAMEAAGADAEAVADAEADAEAEVPAGAEVSAEEELATEEVADAAIEDEEDAAPAAGQVRL